MQTPGRTISILTGLLTSVFLAGCGANSKQVPKIKVIPAQSSAGGSTFTLDLSTYVTDETGTAVYTVVSGGGSFTAGVYTNIFPTLGTYQVKFQVTDFRGEKEIATFDVKITSSEIAVVRNGTGVTMLDVRTGTSVSALQDDGRTKTYKAALTNGSVVFEVNVAAQTDLWLYNPNVPSTDVFAGDSNKNETWALNTSTDLILFVRGASPSRSLHLYNASSKGTTEFTAGSGRDERDAVINKQDVIFFESATAGLADIYSYDVATSKVVAISTHANDEDLVAVLADDGIVFRRKGDGGEWDLLYYKSGVGVVEIGTDLGTTKNLESKEYKGANSDSRVVFETTDGGGDQDIYVWNPANGQTTIIAQTGVDETFAALSGTGRVIYHIQTGGSNKDISQFDASAGTGSAISAHANDDTYKGTTTTGDVIFARDTGATGIDLFRWSQGGAAAAFPDAGGTNSDQIFAKVIKNDDVVYVTAGALSFFRPAAGTSTSVATAAGTESYGGESASGDFLILLVTGGSTHLYLWDSSAGAAGAVSTVAGVAGYQAASAAGLILFSRTAQGETTSNLFSFGPATSTTIQVTNNTKDDTVDAVINAVVN